MGIATLTAEVQSILDALSCPPEQTAEKFTLMLRQIEPLPELPKLKKRLLPYKCDGTLKKRKWRG